MPNKRKKPYKKSHSQPPPPPPPEDPDPLSMSHQPLSPPPPPSPPEPTAVDVAADSADSGGDPENPELPPARKPPRRKPPKKNKPKKPLSKKKRNSIEEKLALLSQTLTPIPFSPSPQTLGQEPLLRALGLWDFARHPDLLSHLPLRPDLLSHLIARYDRPGRCSHVSGLRISLSRADLARALSLPLPKRDAGSDDVDPALFSGEAAASAIRDFIYNYMVFLDDSEILPPEAVAANQLVKEGQPHKVDWAGLMWSMVEREIHEGPKTGKCRYASHLMCLMKYQKPKLFEAEPEVEAAPAIPVEEEKEDTNCELGLSLGLSGDASNAVGEEEKLVSEGKAASVEHCFRRCTSNDVTGASVECNDLSEREEEGKGKEEEEEEEGGLDVKFDSLERLNSVNLLQGMEVDNNVGFEHSLHPALDPSSGEFLVMATESQKEMMRLDSGLDDSLLFGNNCKREFEKIDDGSVDVNGLHQGNEQKKVRRDEAWEQMPSVSAFDECIAEVQSWMGKAKMSLLEKEQEFMNSQLQLEYFTNMMQQKEQIIQSLEKERMEEMQKRQLQLCRYDHEIRSISSVIYGYKKALQETRNEFAEYRKKFPVGEKSSCEDVAVTESIVPGSGELGEQCLSKDEEMRSTIRQMFEDFEQPWLRKMVDYSAGVAKIAKKLVELSQEVKLLEERFAKTRNGEALVE